MRMLLPLLRVAAVVAVAVVVSSCCCCQRWGSVGSTVLAKF